MNADEVAVGMELEAEFPEGWRPATILRGLGADYWSRARFEVRTSRPGKAPGRMTAFRYAHELRLAGRRVAGERGGSASARAATGRVEVEVRAAEAAGSGARDARVLISADRAGDMARALRAGADAAFSWFPNAPDPNPSVWIARAPAGELALCACTGGWPHPFVLLGPLSAAILAEMVESAVADARRLADPLVVGQRSDPTIRMLEQLAEEMDSIGPQKPDSLAGARRRTNDNLRGVFGAG